jgi:multidrug resistance efflux pump
MSKSKETGAEVEVQVGSSTRDQTRDQISAQVESQVADDPHVAEDKLVRKMTIRVLIVALVFFVWYVASDRMTPNTNQARVRGFVVPMAPQVAGVVTDVNVGMNQQVVKGQLLVQIDPDNYEIAVKLAEAELEKAGQSVGADTAEVGSAQAKVVEAKANLRSVQAGAERIIAIEDTGVVTEAEVDRAKADVASAQARVIEAIADLERARENLGEEGASNASIVGAMAKLEKAQLDLSRSVLHAPSDGGVTNVRVHVGFYASVGQPLMTFISSSDVWMEAYMRENNIGNIQAGDEVEFVLDSMPGFVHQGTVTSVGFGVDDNANDQIGGLATVQAPTGWLRDAQRFPVIITFNDNSTSGYRREGGQVDVIVYATDNILMNALAWVWIRVVAYISYLY